MKTKLLSATRTIIVLMLLVLPTLLTVGFVTEGTAYARDPAPNGCDVRQTCEATPVGKNCPGGINVCNDTYVSQCVQKDDCDVVTKYVNPFIRFLILLVGIA